MAKTCREFFSWFIFYSMKNNSSEIWKTDPCLIHVHTFWPYNVTIRMGGGLNMWTKHHYWINPERKEKNTIFLLLWRSELRIRCKESVTSMTFGPKRGINFVYKSNSDVTTKTTANKEYVLATGHLNGAIRYVPIKVLWNRKIFENCLVWKPARLRASKTYEELNITQKTETHDLQGLNYVFKMSKAASLNQILNLILKYDPNMLRKRKRRFQKVFSKKTCNLS